MGELSNVLAFPQCPRQARIRSCNHVKPAQPTVYNIVYFAVNMVLDSENRKPYCNVDQENSEIIH